MVGGDFDVGVAKYAVGWVWVIAVLAGSGFWFKVFVSALIAFNECVEKLQ